MVGVPDQVPVVDDKAFPTVVVPEIVGALETTGICNIAEVPVEVDVTEVTALVAVTVQVITVPASADTNV